MGLLDIFSKKPTPSKIDRAMKRMLNEHHQQQVRQESMEELVEWGTPEAIRALIKRLGANFRDTIVNEREKRWVSDVLVERFGEQAIEPLVSFIREEQAVSAAVRTLAQLVDEDRLVTELIGALKAHEPRDHRTINAKLQLVDALSDHKDPRAVEAVLPHLRDHDDDVRIKVCEVLEAKATPDHPFRTPAIEGLIDLLGDPEAGARILRRAADALRAMQADLTPWAAIVTDRIPDGYGVQDGKMVKR